MNRSEMKVEAKRIFKENYGTAVLVTFLYLLIYSAASSATSGIGAIFLAPLIVGVITAFTQFTRNPETDISVLFDPFRNGDLYLKSVLFLFLRDLFLLLWMLLLIIPAIIKAHSYALVPYLLADREFDYQRENPIAKSRVMMNGYKWELFVLYLSFIGWIILSILTFGILYILYVGPYMHQTRVLFYQKVKAEAFNKRVDY